MLTAKDNGALLQILKRCNRIIEKIESVGEETFNSDEDLKEIICFNVFQIGELANGLS